MADDTSVVPGVSEDTGSVVLQDPYGKLVTVDSSEAPRAIQQGGYQQASPEAIAAKDQEAKYTTPGQKVITGLEGLGDVLTLGTRPLLERAITGSNEESLNRSKYNPYTRGLGMGAAFAIPALGELAGVGEGLGLGATAIQSAGKAVPRALGLGGAEAGIASRIGSVAVQNAIEGGLIGATDEVSKLASGEPAPRVETALTNIGLQGLFGGVVGAGFGSVHPIWKATSGSKLGQTLSAITSKLNGEIPEAGLISEAEKAANLNVPPELRAATSGDEISRNMASTLQDSLSSSGEDFKKAISNIHEQAAKAISDEFGKSPEELAKIPETLSKSEYGSDAGKAVLNKLKAQLEPLSKEFEELRGTAGDVSLPKGEVVPAETNVYGEVTKPEARLPGFTQQLSDKIVELTHREGWDSMVDSEIMNKVNKVMKSLPKANKLSDLTKLISQVGNEFNDWTKPMNARAGELIKDILRNGEDEIVLRKLGEQGPEFVERHQAARAAYRELSLVKDRLQEQLKLGGGKSVGAFVKNLASATTEDGEKLLARLGTTKNASFLNFMREQFPEAADLIKKYHTDDLLKSAVNKAPKGAEFSIPTFFNNVKKLSPEMRSFLISPEAAQKFSGIQDFLDRIPNKINHSGTAPTLIDRVLKFFPESAGAAVALLLHNNPLLGGMIGHVGKLAVRDIPDAARLALLKFLGRSEPIDAAGFKSMVDFYHHMIKGEQTMNRVVKDIFKGTALSFPIKNSLTDSQRKKIEKQVDQFSQQPEKLLNIGGSAGHYMPGEQTALTKTAGNIVQALSMLKPKATVHNIFAGDIPGPKADQQRYEHAIDLANQPLLIMKSLKDNKLTVDEMKFMGALYPALLQRLRGKVMNELVDHISKGGKVPYAQRLNLSLFLGQPLDPSMSPEAIQQSQAVLMAPAQAMSTQSQVPHPQGPHSMKAMSKLPSLYGTPQQAREASRLKDR